MKIENRKIEVTRGTAKVILTVRAYEQKALKGFVNVAVEVEGKFSHAFNDLRIVENKEGEIFLKEPTKYFEKDGEKKDSPIYIAKKSLKDDIVAILNENFK